MESAVKIRIPEIDAYDWLNGLGKHEPSAYEYRVDLKHRFRHPRDTGEANYSSGKYMVIKRQYTDSKTNTRVFVVDWYVMKAYTREDAIRFAKEDLTNHYWGMRKVHRNDEDGEVVIGWR